jgi:CheY-like chemotaxis protein
MSDKKIACYFHPTAVISIDDQQDYLDNLAAKISKDACVKTFSDAFKAVEFLKAQNVEGGFLDKHVTSLKDREDIGDLERDDVARAYTSVDVFDIHKIVYDANRFKKIVVIIVDYAMPGMNGLQVCEALKHMPFKFIMLTGEATPETVIKAFNEGLIHRFVSKSSSKFYDELKTSIYDLQKMQFQEFSEVIVKSLAASPVSSLGDAAFIDFFDNFCKQNNIAEYYLINESGSYLLLDSEGNISILAVKNEREMEENTNVAIDCELSDDIIQNFKSRKKMLFLFGEKDEFQVSVKDWDKYMYPAEKLIGKKGTYYYSHIKDIGRYDIDIDKIVSYREYLSRL